MAKFYEGLGSGLNEEAALAAAQRTMLRDSTVVDPFYWAGFELSGSSRGRQ